MIKKNTKIQINLFIIPQCSLLADNNFVKHKILKSNYYNMYLQLQKKVLK